MELHFQPPIRLYGVMVSEAHGQLYLYHSLPYSICYFPLILYHIHRELLQFMILAGFL